jgi:DNA-binding SARP family transcriptional activator
MISDEDGPTTGAFSDIDDQVLQFRLASQRLREAQQRFTTALDEFIETSAQCWQVLSTSAAQTKREEAPSPRTGAPPRLRIACFGRFQVHRSQELVTPCQNRNGQTILRYLAAQPRHREHGDVLMDVLWPDDPPEVARHKLHCAISALRVSLNGSSFARKRDGYVVHEDGTYGLGDPTRLEIDADILLAGFEAGQRAGRKNAIAHYEAACRLYSGPFLPEDLYAEWSQIRRQQVTQAYLSMCSAVAEHLQTTGKWDAAADWALRIIEENRCDESAYRQLMRAYACQGKRSEAIRQFRRCERVLEEELDVRPMPDTRALFDCIVRGEALPDSRAAGS